MKRVLAVLICAALVGLWGWALNRFAAYCGRRAALAESPTEFLTPAAVRWLAAPPVVAVVSMMVGLMLCIEVLRVVGGFAP